MASRIPSTASFVRPALSTSALDARSVACATVSDFVASVCCAVASAFSDASTVSPADLIRSAIRPAAAWFSAPACAVAACPPRTAASIRSAAVPSFGSSPVSARAAFSSEVVASSSAFAELTSEL